MPNVTNPVTTLTATEKRTLIEKLLTQKAAAPVDFPLASFQQRLWLFEQFEPGTSIFNNALELRFRGTLDVSSLRRAAAEVVRRHESLRTGFTSPDGRPVQRIYPKVPVDVPVFDFGDEVEADQLLQRLCGAEARRPFDMAKPPLLRFALVRLAAEDHVLVMTAHQIVCDGWSVGVLVKELTTLYTDFLEARPPSLPPLRIQYAAATAARDSQAQASRAAADLDYWAEQLDGCPPVSEWPPDRLRPAVMSHSGRLVSRVLAEELRARLAEMSRKNGCTLFMTLAAALDVLFFRHTGQTDIIIGVPVAVRTELDLEPLIGCFVNTVALRTDLSGNPTFAELLARVRRTSLAAYTHQHASFDAVLDRVGATRDAARSPVFQVLLNLLNLPRRQFTVPGVRIEVLPIIELDAKFDLTLYVSERNGQLHLDLVYNPDLYESSTVDALMRRYEHLLDAASRNPEASIAEIPLGVDPPARCVSPLPLEPGFLEFVREDIEQSIASRFEEQASRHAGRCAIATPSHTWTYAELEGRASAVAAELIARVGGRMGMVALLCDHDAPMVAAMLGVLKAGGTYVPLDPLSPVERLAFVIRDAGIQLIVADRANRALAEGLVGGAAWIVDAEAAGVQDGPRSTSRVEPDALAYLLYTSGSTGTPKGVMQSHRNVLHFIRAYTNNLRIRSDDCLSLMSSYCFDSAVQDIYAALLNGATLAIRDVRLCGFADFSDWIRDAGVTIYHSTSSVFRQAFPDETSRGAVAGVRLAVMGGEETRRADFDRFYRLFPRTAWFVNGLGLTESTVTLQNFLPNSAAVDRHTVPVGLPVDGTEVELLDPAGNVTDLHGELVIRSRHVALGYWNEPELSARSFGVCAGSSGIRTYRTGDIVRRLADGSFEFVGRRDSQVKVRGFRIELGEIETVLSSHPAVAAAVVVANSPPDEQRALAAFVTLVPGRTADTRELRKWMKARLPTYMMPQTISRLDRLPLTDSGKINRGALSGSTDHQVADSDGASAEPETETERVLARLWTGLLGVPVVGRDDGFFDLGGHSLRATQLVSRIRDHFGMDMPLRHVFDTPVLRDLAAAIDEAASRRLNSSSATQDRVELEF